MAAKRTEAMIQRAIMDYLETRPDVYAFRAGSGAFKTATGRYVKTGRPGVPDIVACVKNENGTGIWVGLEVKAEKGRQSQAQKRAEHDILTAGGQYYIVRSVADVKEILS